jgi:hypothetical protein
MRHAAATRSNLLDPRAQTETAAPKRRRRYLDTGVAGRVNAP